MTATELKDRIAALLDDKKAFDLAEVELTGKTSVADWFVIASANTRTQAKSLADYVEETLEKEENLRPTHVDGREGGLWLVLDYDAVIVHIFEKETRERYDLEKLWK